MQGLYFKPRNMLFMRTGMMFGKGYISFTIHPKQLLYLG